MTRSTSCSAATRRRAAGTRADRTFPRRAAMAITAVLTTIAAVTACSSSGSAGGGASSPAVSASTSARSSHAPRAQKSATARSTGATSSPGALSGTWHGTYSGGFSGTFTVKWTEGGDRLHGTILISNPSQTMPLNGSLSGSKITFGTVGSTAITYTGTVSSSDASMSGRYAVGNRPAGSWSATKA